MATMFGQKSMGGNDSNGDYGYSIAIDGNGNVYTTGEFWGTVDFDPGAGISNLISAGNNDIFIQKLDAAGNFLLAKRFGNGSQEGVNTIAVDNSGNIHTTGYFVGTVDFDPASSTANLTSAGAQDVYILKWDAAGNYVWVKVLVVLILMVRMLMPLQWMVVVMYIQPESFSKM
jgi:hypothetical protein